MNDIPKNLPPAQAAPDPDDVGILELLIILAKHKKLLIGLLIAGAVIAAAIALVVPPAYRSTVNLLPPQQAQSSAAAMLAQLGGMAGTAAGIAGVKNPSDLYVGMLKSRTVADSLIKRFDLRKVYEQDSHEKTRKILEGNTFITVGKDGIISIEVEDRDRSRAAALANAYAEELLSLTNVLAVTEAAQRRVFFERQLERTKTQLLQAEVALKRQFERSGVISVDGESRAIVETVGRIRAQISAKEIQLASMRAFFTTANPEYKRTHEELISLRAELAKLENGREPDVSATDAKNEGGHESVELMRQVKYYQMLYELLAKQYEMARLDEAKDPGIIQVLDKAIEAEKKSKPKGLLMVVIGSILGFILGLVYAFIHEAKIRLLRKQAVAEKWDELRSHLRVRPEKKLTVSSEG